ncbi:MAG: hypothetical protein MJ066_04315 [Clostridia bacterium]|nr:hypothetical protein [Clostridia bacterium]
MYQVGQAIFGKIGFVDGQIPEYDRPYLIVMVKDYELGIITVSSTQGKEHKLLFPTNKKLINYNPPFLKPSFVKLDSYQTISIDQADAMILLQSGKCLNNIEINEIINRLSI